MLVHGDHLDPAAVNMEKLEIFSGVDLHDSRNLFKKREVSLRRLRRDEGTSQ